MKAKKILILLTLTILLISLCSVAFASDENVTAEDELVSANGHIAPEPIRESTPLLPDGHIAPEPIRE